MHSVWCSIPQTKVMLWGTWCAVNGVTMLNTKDMLWGICCKWSGATSLKMFVADFFSIPINTEERHFTFSALWRCLEHLLMWRVLCLLCFENCRGCSHLCSEIWFRLLWVWFGLSAFLVSYVSVLRTDLGKRSAKLWCQEVCLIIRLAVGLRQCCTGDVRTFRVLEELGHLSWFHFSPLTVIFLRLLLKYFTISSTLPCDVLYRSEASWAHVQCAATLYCVDICNWMISSNLLLLG